MIENIICLCKLTAHIHIAQQNITLSLCRSSPLEKIN